MIDGGLRSLEFACARMLELVFPPLCCHCGSEINHAFQKVETEPFKPISCALCLPCGNELTPSYRKTCQQCGAGFQRLQANLPLANSVGEVSLPSCLHCRYWSLPFQRCFSIGNYEGGVRDAILQIKSGHFDPLLFELAKLLCLKTVNWEFDIVIPIPIHWRRRMGRKTVVSEGLARHIARIGQWKNSPNALRCSRLTKKQGTLSMGERMNNVRNSISTVKARKIFGKRVLIVDDVMTSGATLKEATTVCLKAGAHSVCVAVVARGVGRSRDR
ncbi:MAG: phosphoribosyltransferase family protein [Planctomycetota bacterium]|nr:phosphoribosyltransferase family protein [Planctomycetota bacterium]